jgi:hypothetical protein
MLKMQMSVFISVMVVSEKLATRYKLRQPMSRAKICASIYRRLARINRV